MEIGKISDLMGKPVRIVVGSNRQGFKDAVAEFETVDELLEFLRKAGYDLPADKARTAPLSRATDRGEALYVALGELQRQKKGVSSADLAELVGVSGGRGLSGLSRVWAQILKGLGFEMARVVKRVRRGETNYWLSGPDLPKAIQAMEAARLAGDL